MNQSGQEVQTLLQLMLMTIGFVDASSDSNGTHFRSPDQCSMNDILSIKSESLKIDESSYTIGFDH